MFDRMKHRFGRKWARRDLRPERFSAPREADVPIDTLLIGHQSGRPLERWIPETGEVSRGSTRVADSPYVSFLRAVREKPKLLEDRAAVRGTAYYKMARLCQEHTGYWFGARTDEELLRAVQAFGRMLPEFGGSDQQADGGAAQAIRGKSPPGLPAKVFKIRDSACHELVDGHHRAALLCVEGEQSLPVQVVGQKWTYLQQQVLRCVQTRGRQELYQPIDAPEFDGSWQLVRKCADRLAMMRRFLDERGIDGAGRSALDLACSYGWFVNAFRQLGFDAGGVERDPLAIRIGELAYRLPAGSVRELSVERFLKQELQRFDVVLFLSILHHFSMGRESVRGFKRRSRYSVDYILDRLDAITGSVLFLDAGEEHEAWFKGKLPGWTPEFIAGLLREKTTFREIVPLGVDSDSELFPGNYGRTLFACVR